MAAKAFDLANYGRLLGHAVPVVIENEEQNDHTLEQIRALQAKEQSAEEEQLLKLLLLLVQDFEERHYSLKRATPAETLRELLRTRGMKPKDLWDLFGSKGVASEVLRGKRAISKEKARLLAELFNVPLDLFI